MKIRYALSAMAIVASFTGQQASAQNAPATAATDSQAAEAQARQTNENDIVVTASRRSTELQDTPLPVTAI